MASLKEIKGRINSVKSTRKITSAMKMIASSKLHKAQANITSFLPYQQKMDSILKNLLASESTSESPFVKQRHIKRVAIVAIASNSTLCGAYNASVKKELASLYKEYLHLGKENVEIYAIGKQIEQFVKRDLKTLSQDTWQSLVDKPSFEDVHKLASLLMDKYLSQEIDEIKIVYHHFKSVGTQKLKTTTFLPFLLNDEESTKDGTQNTEKESVDYIYEPNKQVILDSLIPAVLNAKMFAAVLDAVASEHAARMIAMQVATENADELIRTLTIQFNKTRQQAVTNELLDIIGGAAAL